jgi:hypothetical protein
MANNTTQDNIQLRVIIDGSPARKELAEVNASLVKLKETQKALVAEQKELNEARKAAKANGDTAEAQRLSMALILNRKKQEELNKTITEGAAKQAELREQIGNTGLSFTELRNKATGLRAALSKAVPDTPEARALAAELYTLTQRTKEVGGAAGIQAMAWEHLRQGMQLTEMNMRELEMESQRLKTALEKAIPDTPEARQLAADLVLVQRRIQDVGGTAGTQAQAWDHLRQSIALTDMTMEQLGMESARLKSELERTRPNTADYRRLTTELQAVESRTQSLGRTSTTVWGRMRGELTSMATSFLGIGAAIYGAIRGTQTLVRWNAELSDSLADVRKTTNLSEDAVLRLSDKLAGLDTRSSRDELLALAADAGKLGITGEEDLLKFVRAGDQINVALGEDLGEGAIKAIGKLNQTFRVGETSGKDLEQQMLATGSAINVLGMSSTASESFLVDFTTRMAGVNTQANINIQDTLGYAAALDQLGQRSETSSTALAQFTLKAFSNTAEYAKIAGMELKDFSQLLKTNANEALLRTLQGLNGNNEGLARMTTLFSDLGQEGARAVSTLASLAKNTDLVRQQQLLSNDAFREGTSLSEEFGIKNSTLAAQLEKLGNRWKNFWTGLDQGSGAASVGLRAMVSVLSDILGYITEINAQPDILGRNIGSGKGSAVRDERSMDAFRKELAQMVEAEAELAKWRDKTLASRMQVNNLSDYEVSNMRDLVRVTVDRLKTVEDTEAAEARVLEKMEGLDRVTAKHAQLQILVNSILERRKQLTEEVKAAEAAKKGGGVGAAEDGPAPSKTVDTAAEAQLNKELERLDRLEQEYNKVMGEIRLAQLDADARELEQLDIKHAEQLRMVREHQAELVKAGRKTEEEANAELQSVGDSQIKAREDLLKAHAKRKADVIADGEKAIQTLLEEAHTEHLQAEVEYYDRLIDEAREKGQSTVTLERQRMNALKAAQALGGGEVLDLERSRLQALLDLYEQERADAEQAVNDKWEAVILAEKQKAEEYKKSLDAQTLDPDDEQLAAMQTMNDQVAAMEQARNTAIEDINREHREKERAARKAARDAERAEMAQRIQNVANWASALANIMGSVLQLRDTEIASVEKRIDAAAEQRKQDAISAGLDKAAVDAAGQRTEEEIAHLDRLKEARRKAALRHIAVQGAAAVASGISSAMAAGGFPANLLAAAGSIAAVVGLIAQARALMNEGDSGSNSSGSGTNAPNLNNIPLGADGMAVGKGKVLQAKDGGGVLGGNLHSDGGNTLYDDKTGKPLANVEKGEMMLIMSRKATAANADLIPTMLEASRKGERLPIMQREMPMPNPTKVGQAMRVVHMAAGGVLTRGTALVNSPTHGGDSDADSTSVADKYLSSSELVAVMKALLLETRATRKATERFPKELTATTSIVEGDRRRSEYDYMKDLNKGRKVA